MRLLSLSRQIVSGERIAELVRTEVTIRDADDAVEAPPFTGDVRFESVSFGYRPGSPVLRELSFHARPGQLIALVGSSGAGKSTVVTINDRFPAYKGRLIDVSRGTAKVIGLIGPGTGKVHLEVVR